MFTLVSWQNMNHAFEVNHRVKKRYEGDTRHGNFGRISRTTYITIAITITITIKIAGVLKDGTQCRRSLFGEMWREKKASNGVLDVVNMLAVSTNHLSFCYLGFE